MWQCLHMSIISITYDVNTPSIRYVDTDRAEPLISRASGKRWKKAPPKSPPTEKLTR